MSWQRDERRARRVRGERRGRRARDGWRCERSGPGAGVGTDLPWELRGRDAGRAQLVPPGAGFTGNASPSINYLGLIKLVVALVLLGDPVVGQDWLLPGHSGYPAYHDPAITPLGWKLIWIIGGTGLGFGLGWFFSPDAKPLRQVVFLLVSVFFVLFALMSNSLGGMGAAFLIGVIGFCCGIGYFVGQSLRRFLEPPACFGSSKWADETEMREAGLFQSNGLQLGTTLGETPNKLHYSGDRHALTIAPTRSGKGTSLVVPNLLRHTASCLVIDPKAENAKITATARQKMGHEIIALDPWNIAQIEDVAPAHINPLDWVIQGGIDMAENAMTLAEAIIPEQEKGERFWTDEARAHLQGVILYVATAPEEDGQRHLPRVRDLLLLDGDDMQALGMAMLGSAHHLVTSSGARMLQKDSKLLANVLATVQASTHMLDSPRLRNTLSRSDFDFADLKTKAMSIYIILPADRLHSFSGFLRLMVQQALTVNARNIQVQPDQPVLFLLDAMAALGKLSMVEEAYGLMAGFGLQLWGIVQDISQLERIYGKGWQSFIANSGVVSYFGSRDKATAEYFSSLCGVTTVWSLSTAISRAIGSSSGPQGGSSSDSTTNTRTETAAQRQLAYPDELMRLKPGEQLLFIEELNPIRAKKVPWFTDPALKDKGVNLHAQARQANLQRSLIEDLNGALEPEVMAVTASKPTHG